jgi:hypothetical protein
MQPADDDALPRFTFVEVPDVDIQRHAAGALVTLVAMCGLIAGVMVALARRYSVA